MRSSGAADTPALANAGRVHRARTGPAVTAPAPRPSSRSSVNRLHRARVSAPCPRSHCLGGMSRPSKASTAGPPPGPHHLVLPKPHHNSATSGGNALWNGDPENYLRGCWTQLGATASLSKHRGRPKKSAQGWTEQRCLVLHIQVGAGMRSRACGRACGRACRTRTCWFYFKNLWQFRRRCRVH